MTPTVYVDIYQASSTNRTKKGRPQKWRWRALNAGNNHKLAMSSEAYTNKQDCLNAVHQLFGGDTNIELRQPGESNLIVREPSEPDWQLRLPDNGGDDD